MSAPASAAPPHPVTARFHGWNALLPAGRTALMGVLNVTPDSFSDGGRFLNPDLAVDKAAELAAAGADILDIGGESSRPGALPVTAEEECRRVIPVIERIRRAGLSIPISIDTAKAQVAQAALAAGADIINDISALALDPAMAAVAARAACPVILMHMRGTPRTMQENPVYGNVTLEVAAHLEARAAFAIAQGIRREAIALDPGIGFGKTATHNLRLLKGLARLTESGFPVVVGTSRKSFIGQILDVPVTQRSWGTAATVAFCILQGARVVRVHEVAEMAQVARMIHAICEA